MQIISIKTLIHYFFICVHWGVFTRSLKQCFDKSCCKLESSESQDHSCYTGYGHSYRGSANYTTANQKCLNWLLTTDADMNGADKEKYGIGNHNYCRNPDSTGTTRPWCWVEKKTFGYCAVSQCSSTTSDNSQRVVMETGSIQNEKATAEQSNLMFSDQKFTYLLTRGHHQPQSDYVIYRFSDEGMTSFENFPVETVAEAVNLCVGANDVISFATSGGNATYLYVQSQDVAVKINFEKKGWETARRERLENCLDPVLQSIKDNDGAAIRTTFMLGNPQLLLLFTSKHMFECIWKNGILELSYQKTLKDNLHKLPTVLFTNKNNVSFAITTDYSAFDANNRAAGGNHERTKSIHRSHKDFIKYSLTPNITYVVEEKEAIKHKPALAGLIMGYSLINDDSLVKLYDVNNIPTDKSREQNHCPRAGNRSRLLRIFEGKQLMEFVNWLNLQNKSFVEASFHSVNMRSAEFCDDVLDSCCRSLRLQFARIRNSEQFAKKLSKNNKLLWVKCQFQYLHNEACPKLACFNKKKIKKTKNVYAACEIKLGNDQPQKQVFLEDILGTNSGCQVHYGNASDASAKIRRIADTIRSSNRPLQLDILFNSIQALQPINYDELPDTQIQLFVADFLTVVDDLADEHRVNDWVEIKIKSYNMSNSGGPDNSSSSLDPHSLLFITENVLEQVASKENVWNHSSVTMETRNVISTVKKKYFIGNTTELIDNDVNLTVTSLSDNFDQQTVIITSFFPNILKTISNVHKGIMGVSQLCSEDKRCNVSENIMTLPNSAVLSASVFQNNTKLSPSVTFELPYSQRDLPKLSENEKKYYLSCSYLSVKSNGTSWKTSGCQVIDFPSNSNSVTCACNHTTNFAIILQVIPPKISEADLSLLSLFSAIGESLSTFCLIITLTVLGIFRQSLKSDRVIAHFNLISSLIAFHLVQLFSYKAEALKNLSYIPCIAVAFLSHFFLLAAFMWMLCEGITLHFGVLDVFNEIGKFKVTRYFIGWGLPLLIASSSLGYGLYGVPYPTCYVQGVGEHSCNAKSRGECVDPDPDLQLIERCWLSVTNYLIWTLFIPAVFVLLVNTVLLIRVSILISQSSKAINLKHRPSSEKKEKDLTHFKKSLKGIIILMPILGVPWIFGAIPQYLTHVSLLYIFTVLNSTQGIFILLFYCVFNNEVRNVIGRCLTKRKYLSQQQTSTTQTNTRNNQSVDRQKKGTLDPAEVPLCGPRSISSNSNGTSDGTDTLFKNGSPAKEEAFQPIYHRDQIPSEPYPKNATCFRSFSAEFMQQTLLKQTDC